MITKYLWYILSSLYDDYKWSRMITLKWHACGKDWSRMITSDLLWSSAISQDPAWSLRITTNHRESQRSRRIPREPCRLGGFCPTSRTKAWLLILNLKNVILLFSTYRFTDFNWDIMAIANSSTATTSTAAALPTSSRPPPPWSRRARTWPISLLFRGYWLRRSYYKVQY